MMKLKIWYSCIPPLFLSACFSGSDASHTDKTDGIKSVYQAQHREKAEEELNQAPQSVPLKYQPKIHQLPDDLDDRSTLSQFTYRSRYLTPYVFPSQNEVVLFQNNSIRAPKLSEIKDVQLLFYKASDVSDVSHFSQSQMIAIPFDKSAFPDEIADISDEIFNNVGIQSLSGDGKSMVIYQNCFMFSGKQRFGLTASRLLLFEKFEEQWVYKALLYSDTFYSEKQQSESTFHLLPHLSTIDDDGSHIVNSSSLYNLSQPEYKMTQKQDFSDDYLANGHFSSDNTSYIAKVIQSQLWPDVPNNSSIQRYKKEGNTLTLQENLSLSPVMGKTDYITDVYPSPNHTAIASVIEKDNQGLSVILSHKQGDDWVHELIHEEVSGKSPRAAVSWNGEDTLVINYHQSLNVQNFWVYQKAEGRWSNIYKQETSSNAFFSKAQLIRNKDNALHLLYVGDDNQLYIDLLH